MADAHVGLETTYTAATNVNTVIIRLLDDQLDLFAPNDYPLLNLVGMNSIPFEITNTKVEWMEDAMFPTEDLLLSTGGTITATQTMFPVTHGEYFHIGDIIMCQDELMWVTGIDGDNLYVTRAFAGSTGATHIATMTCYIMGNARLEGSSPGIARQVSLTMPFNYTQIIDEVVSATGTQLSTKNYGLPSGEGLLNHRLTKRLEEMNQKLDRQLLYGRRAVGTANSARAFGGLVQFITDTDNISSAALQVSHIETAMENILGRVNDSMLPNLLIGNTWLFRKLQTWWPDWERASRLGGLVVRRCLTPWGELDYLYDRQCLNDDAWLIRSEFIQMGAMAGRGLMEVDASLAGEDATRHRVLGEYTVVVKAATAMCKIYDYSTSA